MQVKALFDFSAEPGSGELSLRAGEILTVSRQDVGEGWWEGINDQGTRGLFPESYVERVATGGPPPLPPPALPSGYRNLIQNQHDDNGWGTTPTMRDSWGTTGAATQARNYGHTASQKSVAPSEGGGADDFDEDWSDDDSVGGRKPEDVHVKMRPPRNIPDDDQSINNDLEKRKSTSSYKSQPSEEEDGDGGHEKQSVKTEKVEHTMDGAGHVITTTGGAKKSIYRFSKFVQSGMEGFILNRSKLNPPPPQERVEIVLTKSGPKWASNPQHEYTCRLTSFKKSTKFKGLKSFITYELTPSFASHAVVSRRYKHFDWLYSQLESKFTFMLIPLLPEKQVGGRFEEDFVEHRMRLLQLWVNKICRHPVMSRADVWMHFLTCHSEESKEWKTGKRKAERDEYVGGNFFFAVSAPAQPLDPSAVEQRFDIFTRKAKALEDAVRTTYQMAAESMKHMCGPFRREFIKYGDAFQSLSFATQDETRANVEADQLSNAIKETADKYEAIGKMYYDQPKFDLEPMMDELFVYKGMLAAVSHIAEIQRTVLSRLREHQKLAEEGKMAPAELETIRSRVDTVSYAMLAEINHFEEEHVRDIKLLIKAFLSAQIQFYDNVRKQLEDVVGNF